MKDRRSGRKRQRRLQLVKMPHEERPSKGEISLLSYNFSDVWKEVNARVKEARCGGFNPSIEEAEADKRSVSYKPAWST